MILFFKILKEECPLRTSDKFNGLELDERSGTLDYADWFCIFSPAPYLIIITILNDY